MSKENNNNALLPSKEFKALCGYHFINLRINHRCMVEKYFFNLKKYWLWNYSLFWLQNNSQIHPLLSICMVSIWSKLPSSCLNYAHSDLCTINSWQTITAYFFHVNQKISLLHLNHFGGSSPVFALAPSTSSLLSFLYCPPASRAFAYLGAFRPPARQLWGWLLHSACGLLLVVFSWTFLKLPA